MNSIRDNTNSGAIIPIDSDAIIPIDSNNITVDNAIIPIDSNNITVDNEIYDKILANFTKLENTDDHQCAEALCMQNECNLGHLLVIPDNPLVISDKRNSQLQTKEISFDEFEAIANKIGEFTERLTRV